MRTDGPTALPPARGPTVLTQTAVRECTGFCVVVGHARVFREDCGFLWIGGNRSSMLSERLCRPHCESTHQMSSRIPGQIERKVSSQCSAPQSASHVMFDALGPWAVSDSASRTDVTCKSSHVSLMGRPDCVPPISARCAWSADWMFTADVGGPLRPRFKRRARSVPVQCAARERTTEHCEHRDCTFPRGILIGRVRIQLETSGRRKTRSVVNGYRI